MNLIFHENSIDNQIATTFLREEFSQFSDDKTEI